VSGRAPDGDADRLVSLQSLTDSALTNLDVDDLLLELLERVGDVLRADTAAVLLLDEASEELVARAARGIEEEVRQGVRIPLGTGFAGRIAATRGPVLLDRVDSTTVANPLLWEKGIKVMLGLPLVSGDKLLGVLHVGRLDERPFGEHDVELLEVVAERVAGAMQTRQLAIERAAAGLLERSLLPTTLPRCAGLDLAARYAAAEDRMVGGDWYDAYTLPSGELWIVVGDVAGHGLNAAVVMGRIRSALRAYSLLDLPPEKVLELVDRKVKHFEIGTFATVVCAVTVPPFDSIRLAVAGHPPPAVAVPGRPTVLAEIELGPPLGVVSDFQRGATTVPLTPGTVIAFYTDGLIERRGEHLDVGLERLRAAVSSDSAANVAREIMQRLVGNSIPQDDIALVILQRR
jgi:sigma-B regulation protein RsbU (phosphoserine phosphatase)